MIVTCTLVDVFTLVYMWTRLENSSSQIDLESIPYRSTYMKLDELYLKKKQKSSSYPPIYNLPRILSQVSSLERSKVFPIWTDLRMIDTGYAPIGERRLLVNQDVRSLTFLCLIRILKISYNLTHTRLIQSLSSMSLTMAWRTVVL